jgi:ribosomal protein S6--L-glutamate ligase
MGRVLNLLKEDSEDIQFLAITKDDANGDTINRMREVASKMGIKFNVVLTKKAFVANEDIKPNEITIHNFDGNNAKLVIDPNNTVALVRGSSLDRTGEAFTRMLENQNVFTINHIDKMLLAQNKLALAQAMQSAKILIPRQAVVADAEGLALAHEAVGGKFPIVIKTLTGAEGIGVSIVESKASLTSNVQTMLNLGGDILIQEFLEADSDIRTLVLDGEILASVKRKQVGDDFRTNVSLGGEFEPHTLSEKEMKIINQVIKKYDGYFYGIDTMESNGKVYLLEVNGSPGTKALYRDMNGNDIDGKKLLQKIFTHALNRMNWKRPFRPIGLIETVKFDNMKEAEAKVDTGNESYNSIHATDIKIADGKVSFTSHDGQRMTLPMVSNVLIRSANDKEEFRPVVEFNIQIGSRKFQEVRFNLADRSNNESPILIGEKFLKEHRFVVNSSKQHLIESRIEKLWRTRNDQEEKLT